MITASEAIDFLRVIHEIATRREDIDIPLDMLTHLLAITETEPTPIPWYRLKTTETVPWTPPVGNIPTFPPLPNVYPQTTPWTPTPLPQPTWTAERSDMNGGCVPSRFERSGVNAIPRASDENSQDAATAYGFITGQKEKQ